MTSQTPTPPQEPKGVTGPQARRSHSVRNRLIGSTIAALVLGTQVLPQPSASAGGSPSDLARSAQVNVQKASVRTLTVRASMNAAYSLRQAAYVTVVAKHNVVIRTTAALRVAPISTQAAIRRALTSQTAVWQAWARLYNQRNASYQHLAQLNATTEADFRAKSARALLTARAVPTIPACRVPANPYAGAAQHRVMSYPGMNITQYAKPGRTALWVTAANLSAPGAKTTVGPLTGRYVAARTRLAQQLAGSGALAGVNGDFYYLGSDQSAWGTVIKRGGGIVKSRTNTGFRDFFVQPNGLADFGSVGVSPVLHQGRYSVRADSLDSHYLPLNGIAIFTSQWGPASRSDLRPRQTVREYVANYRGTITAIRSRASNAGIPTGGLVIVAQGSAIGRLNAAGLRLGKRVTRTSSAISSAGAKVYSAIGVGMIFVQNGQFRISCAPDRLTARTAIGIKPGGREIVLVTVRGQTDSATHHFTGMSVRDMAAFMRSLGVYNAAMFDGGGSTILMAKTGRGYQQFVSGPGWIRPVSNSFGIWRR